MALLYCVERPNPRIPRLFRERVGIDHVRDAEVVSRYRLDRTAIAELTAMLENDLSKPTQRSAAIQPDVQVLVGLRYLAKGDFYSEVADLHGISRSSVSLILDAFLEAVNSKLDNIRFPRERLTPIKLGFFRKSGLPNVVGAVDGTLIPIQGPSENEAVYVCRKGYHAINAQAVVDSNMRFLDIVTRWPGSQHDAFIFENCGLKTVLESDDLGYLLGDSGYPLRRYLITPIANPNTRAEDMFNECHMKGRLVVEKAFGVLKSRFRCLHKTGGWLPFKPTKCCKVAEACFRLHNFCLDRQVPLPETVEPDDSNDNSICCVPPDRTGQQRRRSLVELCA